MRIALVFHGVVPVAHYGGTERVVVWLARGLAELGHEVTLIAGEGTRVPEARVIGVDPRRAESPEFDVRPLLPPGIEVVHAHRPLEVPGYPSLWTMHGTPRPGRRYPPGMVGLSADHARRLGTSLWVHNGLDPADYSFQSEGRGFDLFLGRLHSVKGWQWAVRGARRAGRRLVVAGGWRPPLWRGVRFVGRVGGDRKVDLLAGADCLWMPAQWDEPFGLTVIEAMVSGTPVLGTHRGALPELITPETGAMGNTVEELVALRPSLDRLHPAACRERVNACFTHRTMAEAYLRLYRNAGGRDRTVQEDRRTGNER